MHRSVKKITPRRPNSFDQQFWPITVALTVLSGIAIGAILTLMHGPWMWGSLLLLPAASAVALVLLYHLDDSRLRRSLQLAIVSSLAVHLLVLLVFSVTSIFVNPYKQPQRKIAQRPQKTIEISNRSTQFIWQETNPRDTPEPEITAEKQYETSTDVKPQLVPVENKQQEFNPQLTRRPTPSQTVPRHDQSLSKLSRQTEHLQPKSSRATVGQQATATTQPAPQPTRSTAADTIERQTVVAATASESKPQKAAASPQASKPKAVVTDSSPRRAALARENSQSTPRSSTSSARVKKPTPEIPLVQQKTVDPTPVQRMASNPQKSKPEPSPQSTEITRRQTVSKNERPAQRDRPKTQLSPKPQVARSAQRRISEPTTPSISTPSATAQPKRSVTRAAVAASPIAIEKPIQRPDSRTATNELNSKTLSVSRSTAGIAGAGRSANLERSTGGMTSPATRASDTAARRRTESRPTENRQLTASVATTARRSTGAAKMPSSAFKADTAATAKISGSANPSERTVESSAARIDSASSDHRDAVSAEKGNTTVDLGPTKVVADKTSPRRSGGGQPEVANLNPEATRRSFSQSTQTPTLVAQRGAESVAPAGQTASSSDSQLQASETSTTVAKLGGDAEISAERDESTERGDVTTEGRSELAVELADSRRRTQRQSDSGSIFDEDEDEEDEEKFGNHRTKIAKAPIVKGDPGLGNSQSNQSNLTQSDDETDAPSESLATTVQRRATSTLPGTGLGRSTTSLLVQAATSLPIIQPAVPSRSERRVSPSESQSLENVSLPTKVTSKTARPNVTAKPKMANVPMTKSPAKSGVAGSLATREFDSVEVLIERPESATSDQGAKLEIEAVEGPAGLSELVSEHLGVMARPASIDSEQIQPDLESRFRNTRFGGTPSINPDAVLAKEAFRQRTPAMSANAVEPSTEAAIQLGLEFLSRYQSPDGSWSLGGFDRNHPQHVSQLNSDTAATGLALLAFQGAGYNHREFKYARQVNHALLWLVENQQENGSLYLESDEKSNEAARLYSHGIATLALTEAYGMTQDIQLKAAAQDALDYIVKTQHRRKGGWRYFDGTQGVQSSDTSVTGWMMMALHSGQLAGLEVDQTIFKGIDRWLDSAADQTNPSLYRYNPNAGDSNGISRMMFHKPTPSMTSVGLLMRIYRGWDRNDSRLLDGATYLTQQQMPSDATSRQRDTYYWYYATQVLKYIDGPLWEKWDSQLRPLLIRSQIKTGDMAGSWNPYNPVPDRWGQFGGRLYVTTMNLLSLEVRHRMLPLYQKTNKED